MITIKNRQRKISINIEKLTHNTQILLDALDYSDYDVGILLTTNKSIREYNYTYRKKDKPTDILSFPFYPELAAGKRIKPTTDDDKNLGDMIISLEYVKKAAHELGVSLESRLEVLLVHGICHLLGYDHIEDKDYKIMHKKELYLLKILRSRY